MTHDPFYEAQTLVDEFEDEEKEDTDMNDDDIAADEVLGPIEEEDPDELTPDFDGDE